MPLSCSSIAHDFVLNSTEAFQCLFTEIICQAAHFQSVRVVQCILAGHVRSIRKDTGMDYDNLSSGLHCITHQCTSKESWWARKRIAQAVVALHLSIQQLKDGKESELEVFHLVNQFLCSGTHTMHKLCDNKLPPKPCCQLLLEITIAECFARRSAKSSRAWKDGFTKPWESTYNVNLCQCSWSQAWLYAP